MHVEVIRCFLSMAGAPRKLQQHFESLTDFLTTLIFKVKSISHGWIQFWMKKKMIRPIRIANYVFSRVRKMIRPIRSHSVSFAPKFPPFIAAYSAASQAFNEKSFTQRVFLAKKVKNIFVCFTVDKENGREPAKQQRKGKTERDVSFCCAFYRSYFAFHLSLSLYWNRPFYLNSLIFNCALRTNS